MPSPFKVVRRDHQFMIFQLSIFSFSGINHVINSFQETLLSIDNLIPDTTFDNFTRPYINEKFEDKTCGMFFL
jgi:dynein heavy chain